MGLFDKVRARKPAVVDTPEAGAANPPCPHATLVPRWGSVSEMGQEDKATGYDCDSCKQSFTAEQGRDLRRTEAERLKRTLEE
jgi:hypothetical protein